MRPRFKVGQKIICVNDHYLATPEDYVTFLFPVLGKIYTVRKMFSDSIYLKELINGIGPGRPEEPSFFYWHFAPFVEPDEVIIKIEEEEASLVDCK